MAGFKKTVADRRFLAPPACFFWSEPVAFRRVTVLSLTRRPAGNRTTTGNLSATQECRDTNCTTRTTKLAPPACCQSLPKLELFGCCCRRLSQHGVGELLVPLRHCWRDAFFCVCVFTIGRRDTQFCFGFLMRCLFWAPPLRPPKLRTRQLCGSGCVCRPEFSIIRLVFGLFCCVSCLVVFSVSLHGDGLKDCVLVLHEHYFCGPSSTRWGNFLMP